MSENIINNELLPKIDENVTVVGSGITGCTTAFLLRSEGYNVNILEEREHIFSGTSMGPIQAHLGGFYSSSPDTAFECLNSAILLKKFMPFALREQKARFLVANKSEISLDDYILFYQGLANYYASLKPEDQVFGSPSDFFRILGTNDYKFATNIVGGITTQEPGLNMVSAGYTLLTSLKNMGVNILTNHAVRGIEKRGDRFRLEVSSQDGVKEFFADYVVNASGYKARLLDHEMGDRTFYKLYLKAWNIVKTNVNMRSIPPLYVVRGGFIHYSPLDDEQAILFSSTEDGTYLDSITYNENEAPSLPLEWEETIQSGLIYDKTNRQRRIIERAKDEFLPTAEMAPSELIPGVAVSYDNSIGERKQKDINEVTPGYITLVPTKATHALPLAIKTRDRLRERSREKGKLKENQIEEPQRLQSVETTVRRHIIQTRSARELRRFASDRGW